MNSHVGADDQTRSDIAALDVRAVSKSYRSNLVLDRVSLHVQRGQIVAVIGENGAGKSTLAKLMAGVIRPDSGEIRVHGELVSFSSPRDALRAGVGFIPQELAYFPELSIAENILAGTWPSHGGFVSRRALVEKAIEAARRFGIDLDMRRSMRGLKVGERQLVEIVKVLCRDARVLILDEPTAALTNAESQNLFRVLALLSRRDCGIIYISHRMDEVFRFSDRVNVLRNGSLVASAATSSASPEYLIEQMLGQAAHSLAAVQSAAVPDAPPALALRSWRKGGEPGLKGIDLQVAKGEVVGLFGLRGSGAELVGEGVAGLHRDIEGAIEINGQAAATPASPLAARRSGIGYVPAERKRDGLVLSMSVESNIGLLIMPALSRLGFLRRSFERQSAIRWADRFNIRCRSLSQATSELSGGNQQKVMVASRLAAEPAMFVLQEPTRGVDVGARAELHRHMREIAARGVGLLVVTTDVEEAVLVSDRLLVMREGAVVAELKDGAKTQARALALAGGEAA